MKTITHIPLRELRFAGGRFEEDRGWLSIQLLPELIQFEQILLVAAEAEWRRKYPDKKNLTPGFKDAIKIGLGKIDKGSLTLEINRQVEVEDGSLGIRLDD